MDTCGMEIKKIKFKAAPVSKEEKLIIFYKRRIKMADFFSVTASSGAKIKKGKVEEVMKLLDKYDFSCGLEYQVINDSIEIFGYVWPELWLKEADGDFDDCFDKFLDELYPLLSETLVIHAIGNCKCIFPLSAMEIKVTPHGVHYNEFKWLV